MSNAIAPTENMPATIGIGSDRYAAKVAKVVSPKRIIIERNGRQEVWSLRKDGRWRPQGAGANSGYYLVLGKAETYMDPSF